MVPTLVRYKQSLAGNYYDLGCSLGAGMLALADGHNTEARTIIGVDNSPAMLEQAKINLASYQAKPAIQFELVCADLQHFKLANAALNVDELHIAVYPSRSARRHTQGHFFCH